MEGGLASAVYGGVCVRQALGNTDSRRQVVEMVAIDRVRKEEGISRISEGMARMQI